MSKTCLYLTALFLTTFACASWAQEIANENGLTTITHETGEGRIRLHLPQAVYAGDRISGSVVAEPKDASEEGKTAFSNTISGYVVEVNDAVQTTTENGSFQWVLPESLPVLKLVLRDSDGKAIFRTDAPILSRSDDTFSSGLAPTEIELPAIGQAGHPVQLPGPFDGDSGSTRITIGESPTGILAESPRAAFFQTPTDQLGLHPITVTENGVTTTGAFRAIGFSYDLPKSSLMKGENTELKTRVLGLEGLEQPIELRLINHTPENISIQGGERQIITVNPEDVNTEGEFAFARSITGLNRGEFELTLNLLSSDEKDPCEEIGEAIDSAIERARNKELESDTLEDDAIELEDFADKIEELPPSRWKELADFFDTPREDATETEKASRQETADSLKRLVKKLDESNTGETLRERKRAAKRFRQEAEDLNKKRDRLRAEAEKLREQAEDLRKQHAECLEAQK